MKKSILILLSILCLSVLGLSGCGCSKDAGSSTQAGGGAQQAGQNNNNPAA